MADTCNEGGAITSGIHCIKPEKLKIGKGVSGALVFSVSYSLLILCEKSK